MWECLTFTRDGQHVFTVHHCRIHINGSVVADDSVSNLAEGRA